MQPAKKSFFRRKLDNIKYFFTTYRKQHMIRFVLIISAIAFLIIAAIVGTGLGMYFMLRKPKSSFGYGLNYRSSGSSCGGGHCGGCGKTVGGKCVYR